MLLGKCCTVGLAKRKRSGRMSTDGTVTRVAVIMAGGSGERFWPVSRRDRPKQLLRLASGTKSMLEEAVERIAPLIPKERIFIVTGERLLEAMREGRSGVPEENLIGEPFKRNTAGCLALAAAHLLAKFGGDGSNLSMAVTTADHRIGDEERFRATVRAALEAAERDGVLATHGIVPTRPDTGYGYIQVAEGASPVYQFDGIAVYPVAAFHEKPNREMAEDFIASGRYYWNSGMFFWRVDVFLTELERARPELARAVREMAEAIRHGDKGRVLRIFEGVEDISIDYALMEHAKRVVVARADYPWDDVGAWPSLERARPRDAQGNVTHGDPVLVDCKDCIVYNDAGAEAMAVCVVGAEDLVVVVTSDSVLVVPKDRAQDVRHAVRELRARGARQI